MDGRPTDRGYVLNISPPKSDKKRERLKIKIPVLLLNALDDPLVPEELFVTPHNHVKCNESAIFVITHHGGHLGFVEGGLFDVEPVTWLDKALMQCTIAVIRANQSVDQSSLGKQISNFVIAS
ncbi:monoacylglycerol lipase ABHD2-like [Montipora capricornis]|uniref:monoacylglycerol lipase ABHD2-like n=1 Tax=Montipora capricornis TaxID=246305 RepID=UPI0035F151A3